MSRRAIIDRLYDIFNRSAYEEADAISEDFVFHPLGQGPHPEAVVGREAYVSFLKPDLFVRQWVEVEEVRERGDFALVVLRTGSETVSGATLEQTGFQVWRFDGDLPREAWMFTDREDAERQAGLRD